MCGKLSKTIVRGSRPKNINYLDSANQSPRVVHRLLLIHRTIFGDGGDSRSEIGRDWVMRENQVNGQSALRKGESGQTGDWSSLK